MDISCFELKESGALETADAVEATARWRAGEGAFWVDLKRYKAVDLETWLDALDLQPFVKSLCLDIGKTTQMIALPDYAFLEVTVYADDELSRLANVGALCLENLLITVHPEPVYTIEKKRQWVGELELKDISTSDLLIVLLLIQAREADEAVHAIQNDVTALEERMERDPGSVELEEILDARSAVSKVINVSEEQDECFEVLAAAKTGALDFTNLGGAMKQLVATARSVNRRADRLEKRVTILRQRFEMAQQDTTNRSLAILTVISAIFLPLSLLTGIWGMNFDTMPELHLSFGYPMALGVIAVIGAVLSWFFYKRGWFD